MYIYILHISCISTKKCFCISFGHGYHDENIIATAVPYWVKCPRDGCPQFNATGWGGQTGTSPLTPFHPVFVQELKCSTSNTLISCIHMRWVGTALSPTSYILLLCRKPMFIDIIIIVGKCILKQNFNCVCMWNVTRGMKTCEQGALNRRLSRLMPHTSR